jgi:hypothetical protein
VGLQKALWDFVAKKPCFSEKNAFAFTHPSYMQMVAMDFYCLRYSIFLGDKVLIKILFAAPYRYDRYEAAFFLFYVVSLAKIRIS